VYFAGGLSAAAKCIDPFDKLRADSSARKERVPQDDKGEHDWFAVVAQLNFSVNSASLPSRTPRSKSFDARQINSL
jgi:hypothetical protein